MKISKELKRLLIRTILFIFLFVLLTGIIGPWVIRTQLLYGFNFFIYGNLGKLVIFSVIIFFLLTRDRLNKLKVTKFTRSNYIFFTAAVILTPLFFYVSNLLLKYKSFNDNLFLSLFTHLILISIPSLLLLAVFGTKFLTNFYKNFKKEIGICLGLSLVLFFSIFQVWKLWPYLSAIVLQSEYFIYSHIFQNVFIIPPRGLFINTFAVEIEEACSGLESIFLFTVLYIFISVIDHKKLNIKKVILLFPFLLICLVIINIIRVFLLILTGVLINPQIMITLFHTYLGLILFVIFFLAFMRWGYDWLKKNHP